MFPDIDTIKVAIEADRTHSDQADSNQRPVLKRASMIADLMTVSQLKCGDMKQADAKSFTYHDDEWFKA